MRFFFVVDRLKEERRLVVAVDEQFEVVRKKMGHFSVKIVEAIQVETEVLLENELIGQVDRHPNTVQILFDLTRTVMNKLFDADMLVLGVQVGIV